MNSSDEIKLLLSKKELFLFDLDGTLFNTLGDLAPAVNYAMKHFGLSTHSVDLIQTFIGNGALNLVRRAIAAHFIKNDLGEPKKAGGGCDFEKSIREEKIVAEVLTREGYTEEKIAEIYNVYTEYYWDHCTENTEPYEGVLESIKKINAKNKRAAMLTNKPFAPSKKILQKFGLENAFAVILCGDTTPERKPSPAGIFEILRQTGVAPEKAVMIGDDTPDVMAARNAGIDCITLLEGFGKCENLLPLEPRYRVGHIKDLVGFSLQ